MHVISITVLLSLLSLLHIVASQYYNAILMDGVSGTQLYYPQDQNAINNLTFGLQHCKFSIAFNINNFAYFICDGTLKRFNSVNLTTTNCDNLITSRQGAGATVFNNEIVVCGGASTSNKDAPLLSSCEKYNTDADQWTQMTSLPIAISSLAMATISNRLYVFGGFTGDTSPCSGSSAVYVYFNDRWNVRQQIPTPIYSHTAITISNDSALICGGTGIENGQCTNAMMGCYLYNVSSNDWTQTASMAVGRALHSGVMANGTYYIFGGVKSDNATTDIVEMYTVNSGSTTMAKRMAIADYAFGAAAIQISNYQMSTTAMPDVTTKGSSFTTLSALLYVIFLKHLL